MAKHAATEAIACWAITNVWLAFAPPAWAVARRGGARAALEVAQSLCQLSVTVNAVKPQLLNISTTRR
jgi:hypothetical protein